MPSRNQIDLAVVVNGQPTTIAANSNAPLRSIIGRVLEETGNAGQPAENWELRDANGTLLDISRKIESFDFASGATLFLNLKAGVGG